MSEPAVTEETTYCAVHPDRETSLRCNKCGRLMCADCAVPTPVGYRCRECVRGMEDKYFTATNNDYLIIFGICFGLSLIGGTLASAIRLGIIMIFPAIIIGGAIGEAALRAVQRRRGRRSAQVALAGTILGGLLGSPVYLFLRFGVLVIMPELIVRDFTLLLFIGVLAVTVYGRFQMRI